MGTLLLKLPSDKILELKDCYYMPSIIKNIIFISMLLEHGFEIKRKGNSYFIYLSNEFYGNTFIDNSLLC